VGERGKFPTWLIGPYAPCTNNKRRKRRGKKRGRLGCQQYWDVTCPLSRSSIVLPLGKMGKEKIHFHQNKPKKKESLMTLPFFDSSSSERAYMYIYLLHIMVPNKVWYTVYSSRGDIQRRDTGRLLFISFFKKRGAMSRIELSPFIRGRKRKMPPHYHTWLSTPDSIGNHSFLSRDRLVEKKKK